MSLFWRASMWFGRLVLLAATVLFTLIGWKFLSQPVAAAGGSGIALESAEAITRLRVGFGAFPLSFAILVVPCLVSRRRLLMGLWIVMTVLVIVTATRILGIRVDGPAAESLHLLRNEVGFIVAAAIAIILEVARRSRMLTSQLREGVIGD